MINQTKRNQPKRNFIKIFLFFLSAFFCNDVYPQFASDGSYFWNVTNVNYTINEKTYLFLNTKEHFSNQTDRIDFFHLELTAYRKLTPKFSMGLGYRQTESYKLSNWYAGHNYLLYGMCIFSPANLKIKFANRVVYKSFKNADSQIGLDNMTNVDFFARSTSKIPKPYVADELFSELKSFKLQNVRFYGGLHLLKAEHLSVDVFYCYWMTCGGIDWKNYDVYGLCTKFSI